MYKRQGEFYNLIFAHMATKNMFKGIADDSDDDNAVLKQKITKTQKKKEANRIGGTTAATDEKAFY